MPSAMNTHALMLCVAMSARVCGPSSADAARPARPAPAKSTAPDPAVMAAEMDYQGAMSAFSAGDREGAKRLFERALAALPATHPLHAQTLYNLAFVADAEAEAAAPPLANSPGSPDRTDRTDRACAAAEAYGRYLDEAPNTGSHVRTRQLASGRRAKFMAVCDAGQTETAETVETPPTDTATGEGRAGWLLPTAAVGSVLAAGAGAGLYFWGRSTLDDRHAAYERYLVAPDRAAAQRQVRRAGDAEDKARALGTGSTVAFVFAGVLGGAAGYLWLTEPMASSTGTPSSRVARMGLGLSPGGVWFTWTGP